MEKELDKKDNSQSLKTYSLAYAYVKNAKVLDKRWENEFSRPKNIKKMIKKIKDICGCDVELKVNYADMAIEIMSTKELNNLVRIKACDFLKANDYVIFSDVYACTSEGKVIKINQEERVKMDNIYRLSNSSFLACGMYSPDEANLVSMGNEEGHRSLTEHWGFTDDLNVIEEFSEDKIVIKGETKLYENKFYNYAGESIDLPLFPKDFLSFQTKLIDKLGYDLTIILSDNMVAKITTKYRDSREVSSTHKLPFGTKFPNAQSIRDNFLPFPKESGEYEGIIEEYFMRSTDGTKLLHYATHTPYFEIYDIPEDFDFVNNNKALDKCPSVYDFREYNPEDPKIEPVKGLIDETVRKLKLTTTN